MVDDLPRVKAGTFDPRRPRQGANGVARHIEETSRHQPTLNYRTISPVLVKLEQHRTSRRSGGRPTLIASLSPGCPTDPIAMRLPSRVCVAWGATLASAAIVWLPHRALSQDSSVAQRGVVIDGTVRSASGRPLAGVTVEILGVTSLQTDSVGVFRVIGLGSGTYIFRVRKVGFTPSMKAVTVRGATELSLPITLDPVAQQLAPVVTNADSARLALADPSGFAWRRRMGQGTYITQAEIERRRPVETEQLFRGIPDMTVDTAGIIVVNRGRITFRDLQSDSVPTYDQCVGVHVFVDGAAMPQPFNVDLITPGRIRGIEIYRGPAATPPALRSAKTVCGTVAIWTR